MFKDVRTLAPTDDADDGGGDKDVDDSNQDDKDTNSDESFVAVESLTDFEEIIFYKRRFTVLAWEAAKKFHH